MSLSDGQYLTRHRRCTVRLQPLFRFDHDRSGRRQLLNLCSPVDGKPSVADLEDYPLADYVLSSTPLRKLDDALHRMRFSGRRTAIPAWSAFLGCELPHCYRITPHVAGNSPGSYARRVTVFKENISHFVRNEPMRNVVDKQKGY